MTVLLDTHTFLWFIAGHASLSDTARQRIEDPSTERLLSVASLWEMSIKASLGRLQIRLPFPELVTQQVEGNGIRVLGIKPFHLEALRTLPFHHRDPFDRLMIAQALIEGIPILGKDRAFAAYPVTTIW
ncbi:MAG: type II toxin-antitoxin system VapC family toxin [Bacteroidota bacterium]